MLYCGGMNQRRQLVYQRAALALRRVVWPVARQTLGWLCIAVGLLGLVLPLLQGVLFLVIGVALVGRRNWLIRRSTLAIKRGLRRWARVRTPVLGLAGRLALRAQHQCSRQSRRLHRRLAERRRWRALAAAPLRMYDYTNEPHD